MTKHLEDVTGLEAVLAGLGKHSYDVSAAHGFHDLDELVALNGTPNAEATYAELQDTKRQFLMVSELCEAFEELRNGRRPDETYYTLSRPYTTGMPPQVLPKGTPFSEVDKLQLEEADPENTVGLFKPEGIPSELADVVIRLFDYSHMRGINIGAAIHEKTTYNQQREAMHGKKF